MAFDLSQRPYLERDAAGGVTLIASVCEDCDQRVFPPAAVCPHCMGERMRDLPLAGQGRLYSFTVIRQAVPDFAVPFAVGFVDMPEGVRVFSHITVSDPGLLSCDMTMKVVASAPIRDHFERDVRLFAFELVHAEAR